jgi:plasmid stability protein
MQMADLKVRIPFDVKNWLALRAADNTRSKNAELIDIIRAVMATQPAYATVRHCKTADQEWYAVALGESTEDFCETGTKEEAIKAAREKLASLGFSRPCVEFKAEFIGVRGVE